MQSGDTTTIHCTREIRKLWPRLLAAQWAREYPQVFDRDDLRLALSQPRNHFAEWSAAIHLLQRDGVHALVEKYAFQNHARKVKMYQSLLFESRRRALNSICASLGVQPPDLLLYRSNLQVEGLAEVKGPGDRLSSTRLQSHAAITDALRLPVEIVVVRFAN
jgi:hypothetical protein